MKKISRDDLVVMEIFVPRWMRDELTIAAIRQNLNRNNYMAQIFQAELRRIALNSVRNIESNEPTRTETTTTAG